MKTVTKIILGGLGVTFFRKIYHATKKISDQDKLTSCRVCGKSLSPEALTCPHCSDPNPRGNLHKCSRCGKYVKSIGDYNGSSIGIGLVKDVCSKCWDEVADIDESM